MIRYDVALSYAREQRELVEQVRDACANAGLRVFYHRDLALQWWGENYLLRLRQVYGEQSLFVAAFLSDEYFTRACARDEYEAALLTHLSIGRTRLLPILVGDACVPAWYLSPHIQHLRADEYSATDLAQAIKAKVDAATARTPTTPA